MIPTRRPGRSSRGPRFARTFMTNENPFQPTRVPGPSSRQQAPPASGGGMTTAVQPGEPHYLNVRIDRQNADVPGDLCRCQNPAIHGDAHSLRGPKYEASELDIHGNRISWKELSHRVLDFYGKPTVTQEEEYASYRYLLHPMCYRARMEDYYELRRHVAMGGDVVCSLTPSALQFHGGDGLARNEITERGVRTMVDRPGRFPASGTFGGSSGGPRFSRP